MNELVFTGQTYHVKIGDYIFSDESGLRPDYEIGGLDFPYDALYYEPSNNNFIKFLDGKSIALTAQEKMICKTFIANFMQNADYPVFTFDRDSRLFLGTENSRKAAQESGLGTTLVEPENPLVKFNIPKEQWESIVFVLYDDGFWDENPDTIGNNYVKLFTEEEYAIFNKPPSVSHKFDFATEQWVETRVLSDAIEGLKLKVRNSFEAARWKVWGKFIPTYEQLTWDAQVREAQKFTETGSLDECPYMSAYLEDLVTPRDPEDLALDILENHENYLKGMARVNAHQKNTLEQISACTSLAQVDELHKTLEIERLVSATASNIIGDTPAS